MFWIVRYSILLSVSVLAENECLCNINGVTEVWANVNKHGQPMGVLHPSDCKPLVASLHGHTQGFWEIYFANNKIGYVETSINVHNQTCSAEVTTAISHTTEEATIASSAAITRSTHTATTVPMSHTTKHTVATASSTPHIAPFTHTAEKTGTTATASTSKTARTPTTKFSHTTEEIRTATASSPKTTGSTSIATFSHTTEEISTEAASSPKTTESTPTAPITHTTEETTVVTTSRSTAANTLPNVMANGCPAHIQEDAAKYGGFAAQFGSYCYELVNIISVWNHSEEHCQFTSTEGHLLRIINETEQKFIQQFLSSHHYSESVWIGLSDHDVEGALKWTTRDAVTYTNFQEEFHNHTNEQHELNDCFLFKANGEWTDVPCGTAISFFFGFGEKHPFICQYKLTSKKPPLMDIIFALIG